MLSADLPFRLLDRQMDLAFPESSNNLLIVIDAQNSDIADYAGKRLAKVLRENSKYFGQIHYLEGETFFKRNGLLYLSLDDLYSLSDSLAFAQPYIGALSKELNLRGLFNILGKGIDLIGAQGGETQKDFWEFLNRVTEVAEAQEQGQFLQFSWQGLMKRSEVQGGLARRFILLKPALNYELINPASQVMASLRQLTESLLLTPEYGVKVRLSGSLALEKEELETVEKGIGVSLFFSLILVLSLLVIGLKHYQLVISTLLSLIIGLILTTFFAVVALDAFNLISVAFAVLFVGLAVDFGIHYSLRYQEEIKNGLGHKEALTASAIQIASPLTLTAVCACISFYSFLPTDYSGLAELGLIAGTGMLIALFTTITLLPAFFTVLPEIKTASSTNLGRLVFFDKFIGKNAYKIVLVFLSFGVVSSLLFPRISFDFDPINLKNKSGQAMATLIELMEDGEVNPYSLEVLVPNLEKAEELALTLSNLKVVERVEVISDYVPNDQNEKLELISSMALFLSPSIEGADELKKLTKNERLLEYNKFKNQLLAAISKKLNGDQKETIVRLQVALKNIVEKSSDELSRFENRMLISLPLQLQNLKQSLNASVITLEDLPVSIRNLNITVDGRVRVEVFPRADLRNPELLELFVRKIKKLVPNAIGSPVIIVEARQTVLSAFYKAGIISMVAIFFLLFGVLRNFWVVGIIFIPIILTGILSCAVTVLLDLSFNFANVIVLPLLVGIGVAGSLHLVMRNNVEQSDRKLLFTSTPRAVLFSALTTICSFGTISFSDHPGTASMGLLLTISISVTLLCTLVFLPAFLKLASNFNFKGANIKFP